MTAADMVIVMRLCQFGNDFLGPYAWLCRLAWLTCCERLPFDPAAAVDEHANWLNNREHAKERANIIACMEWLQRTAEKKPLWDLPGDPFDVDVTQWLDTTDAN